MANPVLISDIETRFRPFSAAEVPSAQALLDDAWVILLSRMPTLETRMVSGAVSDALVRAVVSAMAVRVLRNPDAIKQWAVDDASFTRDAALSSGALYVSADELELLSGAVPSSAAFTIRPSGVSVSAPYRISW